MSITVLSGIDPAFVANRDVKWVCAYCGRIQVKRYGSVVRSTKPWFYCTGVKCRKLNDRPRVLGIRDKGGHGNA